MMQETRAEDISNKLSNLKKEEKSRAKKIQEVERAIQNLQADLTKPIDVENMTQIDDETVRLCPFRKCAFPDFQTSVQRRLNQRHNGTRERQIDLKEQQRRLVEDESRAKAEVAEGERAYALFFLVSLAPVYSSGALG